MDKAPTPWPHTSMWRNFYYRFLGSLDSFTHLCAGMSYLIHAIVGTWCAHQPLPLCFFSFASPKGVSIPFVLCHMREALLLSSCANICMCKSNSWMMYSSHTVQLALLDNKGDFLILVFINPFYTSHLFPNSGEEERGVIYWLLKLYHSISAFPSIPLATIVNNLFLA